MAMRRNPFTPGREQEVVGVEVIPAASCHELSQVLETSQIGKHACAYDWRRTSSRNEALP
jgi:hypothetical protein